MKKETEFEGYVSGDYECFCLSKVPFDQWTKIQHKRMKAGDYPYPDPLLLYPNDFFPKEAREGKWRFKITVEAEQVKGGG